MVFSSESETAPSLHLLAQVSISSLSQYPCRTAWILVSRRFLSVSSFSQFIGKTKISSVNILFPTHTLAARIYSVEKEKEKGAAVLTHSSSLIKFSAWLTGPAEGRELVGQKGRAWRRWWTPLFWRPISILCRSEVIIELWAPALILTWYESPPGDTRLLHGPRVYFPADPKQYRSSLKCLAASLCHHPYKTGSN